MNELEGYRAKLQEAAGEAFVIEAVLTIDAASTEVRVLDRAGKRRYCARIYPIPENLSAFVESAWNMSMGESDVKLSQPIYGMKNMGALRVVVAAYPKGLDLAAYNRIVGRSHPQFAARLGVAILKILNELQNQDLGHYNLRPSDIVLSSDGRIILKNSGISAFEQILTRKLNLSDIQDILYQPPEQLQDQPPMPQTEMYQLGAILFEMIAGRTPYVGDYEAVKQGHLQDAVPDLAQFNPDADAEIINVLQRALAKDDSHRYEDYDAFREALESLLPAVERSGFANQQPDQEDPRIMPQLKTAQQQAQGKDFQGALRTLDAVLSKAGPRNDAMQFYRKVWQAYNGRRLQGAFQAAQEAFEKGEHNQALRALNLVLSLQAHHPPAFQLQAKIFEALGDQPLVQTAATPVQRIAEAAKDALEAKNELLAKALWTKLSLVQIGDAKIAAKVQAEQARIAPLFSPQAAKPAAPVEPQQTVVISDLNLDELDDFGDVEPPPPEPKTFITPSSVTETEPLPVMKPPGSDTPAAKTPPPPLVRHKTPPKPSAADTVPDGGKDQLPPKLEPIEDIFKEGEDLIGPTPPVQPPTPEKKTKKAPPMPLIIGAAAAALLIIAVVVVVMVMGANKRKAAMEAYAAAERQEQSGDWDGALTAWASVRDQYGDVSFPEAGADERFKTLEYRIAERDRIIQENLDRLDALLADTGTPLYEMSEDPSIYLSKIFEYGENAQAQQRLDAIRTRLTDRAWALWEAEEVEEARTAHDYLIAINPDYRDALLADNINTWIQEKVLGPQLARLDGAIAKKQWDRAFEVTEELRETLEDATLVDRRWDEIYADYNNRYEAALIDNDEPKMLAALNMMSRIKPDDIALRDQKDQLSRNLNLSRILALEDKIKKDLSANRLSNAARTALQLQRVESENKVAKNAVGRFRGFYEDKAKQAAKDNPRAAVKHYDTLIATLNWRMHRKSRTELQNRIKTFDAAVKSAKSNNITDFAAYKQNLDDAIARFTDFSADGEYAWLQQRRDMAVSEHQRFERLQQFETRARNDITQTYADVLAKIRAEKPFAFTYAKSSRQAMIKRYDDAIRNYSGEVTLVIRTARGIEKGKGLFRGKAYCRFETAGQRFQTEQENMRGALAWNYAATFDAKAGEPLTFSVMRSRGNEVIGVAQLPGVPASGKGLEIQADNGAFTLVIDVKRAR